MATEDILNELNMLYKTLQSGTPNQAHNISSNESGDNAQLEQIVAEKFSPLQKRIDDVMTEMSTEDTNYIRVLSMKASTLYEKAKILMSMGLSTPSLADLMEARDIVTPIKENVFIVYLYMRILNHISYTLSKMGEYSKSKELLENTLEMKVSADDINVYNTEELFSGKEGDPATKPSKVHRLKINNMQMLSWVYSKIGLNNSSSLEQHLILAEELKFGEIDPIEWATRCARVAILHLTQENWVTARYYLSVSAAQLNGIEREMIEHPVVNKAFAELARAWVYYGLRLFDSSRSREMERVCNRLFDEKVNDDEQMYEELPPNDELHFKDLQVVPLEQIPASLVHNSETARCLFQATQTWMKRARMYYTLRDHPFIHVNCILDLSELYRFLAFFDPDIEAQYTYQQRRAGALDTLCSVLKEVRPQCFAAVSIELFRELAEVQIEMLNINMKRVSRSEQSGAVDDIDHLQRRLEATHTIRDKLEKFGEGFEQIDCSNCDMAASPTCHDEEMPGSSAQSVAANVE